MSVSHHRIAYGKERKKERKKERNRITTYVFLESQVQNIGLLLVLGGDLHTKPNRLSGTRHLLCLF